MRAASEAHHAYYTLNFSIAAKIEQKHRKMNSLNAHQSTILTTDTQKLEKVMNLCF